eukprot:632633-Amphidinium_carterae.1
MGSGNFGYVTGKSMPFAVLGATEVGFGYPAVTHVPHELWADVGSQTSGEAVAKLLTNLGTVGGGSLECIAR